MTKSQLANIEKHKWQKGQSGNMSGRKKDRVKELLRQVLPKNKLKKSEALSLDEINTIERMVLSLEANDLRLLCATDDTPAYARTLAVAALTDMKMGKTTTVDKLRDRQYGAAKQSVDVTSNGMCIGQQRSMTPDEARALLNELDNEF